jgi:hypothetical protein
MAKMKIFVGSRRDVPPERLYKAQGIADKGDTKTQIYY